MGTKEPNHKPRTIPRPETHHQPITTTTLKSIEPE